MGKTIEQLIDEQVRAWEQSNLVDARKKSKSIHWPIIAFSRDFGAQGGALAQMVGQRLGFRVWDTELVHAISEVSAGDEHLMNALDEHHRATIEDMVRGTLQSTNSNVHYLRPLLRVIQSIEEHGESIVLGRGAQYIAKADTILRVRVVCPIAERVRRYALRNKIEERKAYRIVAEKDAERADFIRHSFKRDVTEPSDYDLVLNSMSLSLEQLSDIVVQAYQSKVGRLPTKTPVAV